MIDSNTLKDILEGYKEYFPKHWNDEKFKWEAIKCFQDNWDVNADDFSDMLSRSLSNTKNLLSSMNNFPRGMIEKFAKAAPEEVRSMFIALFDETREIYERINEFKVQSSVMLEKYCKESKQHYQYENAISTYLWLRYPDKYYIYQFTESKDIAEKLKSDSSIAKRDATPLVPA